FSKISDYAQKANDPLKYLKTNIDNLRNIYPDKFKFIVWDENGVINKNISDKTSYNYVLSKVYDSLKEVTQSVKSDPTTKISELNIVKKNKNLLS
ncbi:MAG: hypothetical protein J6Z11_10100, partial [Candidatus Riflebacteria bacterium]|nr:hypothetical protein [Candidatus Riflebacteria bacterium]